MVLINRKEQQAGKTTVSKTCFCFAASSSKITAFQHSSQLANTVDKGNDRKTNSRRQFPRASSKHKMSKHKSHKTHQTHVRLIARPIVFGNQPSRHTDKHVRRIGLDLEASGTFKQHTHN